MGSITAHITGKVNPHYGVFLGGTYAPGTSINSPVAMEKGSDFFLEKNSERKELDLRASTEKEREPNSSTNLLRTS